jgi:hypothetical protein
MQNAARARYHYTNASRLGFSQSGGHIPKYLYSSWQTVNPALSVPACVRVSKFLVSLACFSSPHARVRSNVFKRGRCFVYMDYECVRSCVCDRRTRALFAY